MKIKLKRTPGVGYDCPLCEGETGDVSEEIGQRLIDSGIAVAIGKPKTIQAVPPPASIQSEPEKPAEPKPTRKRKESKHDEC